MIYYSSITSGFVIRSDSTVESRVQSFTTIWDTTIIWDKLNFHTHLESICINLYLTNLNYILATFDVYMRRDSNQWILF